MPGDAKGAAQDERRPCFFAKPQAILFDLDDTVFDFTACSQQALRRACQAQGIPFDGQRYQAYRMIDDALWDEQRAGRYTVQQVMQMRFVRWFEYLGLSADERAFSLVYERELGRAHVLEPDAREVLIALAARWPLYAASNGLADMQRQRLEEAGLHALFSSVFVSDEIGYEKPDTRFFQACLARMNTKASPSIWMVGDSAVADVAGAQRAGLSACLYARHPQKQGLIKPHHTIARLRELLSIFL